MAANYSVQIFDQMTRHADRGLVIEYNGEEYTVASVDTSGYVALRDANDGVFSIGIEEAYTEAKWAQYRELTRRIAGASTTEAAQVAYDMATAFGQEVGRRHTHDRIILGGIASALTDSPHYGDAILERLALDTGFSRQSITNYRLVRRCFSDDEYNDEAIEHGAIYGQFLEAYRQAAAKLAKNEIETWEALRVEAHENLNRALDKGLTVAQMKAGLDGSGPVSCVGSTNRAIMSNAHGTSVTLSSLPEELVRALRGHQGATMRVVFSLVSIPEPTAESDDDGDE